jgi:hypothetical protein
MGSCNLLELQYLAVISVLMGRTIVDVFYCTMMAQQTKTQ